MATARGLYREVLPMTSPILIALAFSLGYASCVWTFCRRQAKKFAELRAESLRDVADILDNSQAGLKLAEDRTDNAVAQLAQVVAIESALRRILWSESRIAPHTIHMTKDENGEPWADVIYVRVGKEAGMRN